MRVFLLRIDGQKKPYFNFWRKTRKISWDYKFPSE